MSRKVKRLVKSLLQPSGMTQSRRSQKWGVRLSKAVCSRPVQPTRIRNRTAPPKRKAALLRSHPGVSRAAKAFTAPNPFHRLPGKR
jgi:hypothetical protein